MEAKKSNLGQRGADNLISYGGRQVKRETCTSKEKEKDWGLQAKQRILRWQTYSILTLRQDKIFSQTN